MPWYETAWNAIKDFFINNWATILIFIAVLIFGFIIVKILLMVFGRIMKRTKLNGIAVKFLTSIVKIFLYIIYLIALLSLLGIPTTSLVALVSVGALAISLAVQNVISNLASGIEIVVTRPFVEGDLVEIDGITGNVDRITITNTRLITPDLRTVTIPNSKISTSSVINYTTQPTRRVDISISVAYGTDVEKVKSIIKQVADSNELVLKDPEPSIRVCAHTSRAIDFTVKVWTNNAQYWDVNFDMYEQILAAFEQNGIEIPFDQLDVHVVPEPTASGGSVAATTESVSLPAENSAREFADDSATAKTDQAEQPAASPEKRKITRAKKK